jgi:hypothetical protein
MECILIYKQKKDGVGLMHSARSVELYSYICVGCYVYQLGDCNLSFCSNEAESDGPDIAYILFALQYPHIRLASTRKCLGYC